MARTKSYKAPRARTAQARPSQKDPEANAPVADADGARIDMVSLLGPGARFARNERCVDLSDWLGRGIDAWVWASVACLRAMLRSGARETASVATYSDKIKIFFRYLTDGVHRTKASRPNDPADLSPVHVQAFVGWLQNRGQSLDWTATTSRHTFNSVKSVLLEMFAQGFISGEPSRFFTRASLPWREGESRQTSLSDDEQERLAQAIKSDLVAIHHGRTSLKPGDVQALRLLLVAHRQGTNPTPLLELRRDALSLGFLPGTVRIRTAKYRNRKIRSGIGRAAAGAATSKDEQEVDVVFSLAEGAVLQQAIKSSRDLAEEAPEVLRNRVWLYRAQTSAPGIKRGQVTCLTNVTLRDAIKLLVERHQLLGDDGEPLRINLSRLRKSFFDRALRASDGDLAVTANLMGNTPRVASLNYPSMNNALQAEAAAFMNDEYVGLMRSGAGGGDAGCAPLQVVEVRPFKSTANATPTALPTHTPVSGCTDTLNGQHAPRDGHSHCDRYVMCLFCSSFAIVGSVDELWRLFSFQTFAKEELQYLDTMLGPERTGDESLEDLRDRYRLAIPFIDEFTRRQFAASRVAQSRARTEAGLHPFWRHQMTMSRRGRAGRTDPQRVSGAPPQDDQAGDLVGT